MKCEKCAEEGAKSSTWAMGLGSTTLVYSKTFYDEEGQAHDHDLNWHEQDYRCSEGHSWTFRHRLGCPATGCNYGAMMEVIYKDFLDV